MGHTNKADHPRERLNVTHLPSQPQDAPQLAVMQRTDGRFIVYDPQRPFGERTAWLGAQGGPIDAAHAAARELATGGPCG